MQKLINKFKDNSIIQSDNLTYKNLFIFYIPLGVSTLAITLSNLLLARCIGYFPDSELYISSYSVARTLIQIFHFPVTTISFLIATFTVNEYSFLKVRKFVLAIFAFTVVMLFTLAYTPLGEYILKTYFHLNGDLLDYSVVSLKIMMFFPLFISVRGYFLGIALKLRKLRFATFGSILRLIFILIASFNIPAILKIIKPEYLPGTLLVVMVMIEALVFSLGVLKITAGRIKSHIVYALKDQNLFSLNEDTTYIKMLKFSVPMMLSFMIAQILPGFTQSALALSENKVTILAVYTISLSLSNIVAAFSFQIPQLIVNHDSFSKNNRVTIRRFAFMLAGFSTIVMFIIAFTPIGTFILTQLLEVSQSSAKIAMITIKFALLNPASAIFMTYKRGKLLKIKRTNMLIFERVVGAFLPYILIFIIPIINWEYAAAMGILIFTLSNFASGLFSNLVFRINVKRHPDLINHTL